MKKKILFSLTLLILSFGCKNPTIKKPYSLFFEMDKGVLVEKKVNFRKKATIPFHSNQIYDPFFSNNKKGRSKSTFEKGIQDSLHIVVIDTVISRINIEKRKNRNEELRQAFGVIIENKDKKKYNYLPLHRGCAVLIQQAQQKNGNWVDLETKHIEKIGDYYYKIKAKQYVYTKIPIYKGSDSATMRVKLELEDTIIYSNLYKSTVPNWVPN